MSDSEDLKAALQKLKGEVNWQEEVRPLPAQFAAPGPEAQKPRREPPRAYAPYGGGGREPLNRGSSSWGENKETLLFGMLASLVMALGGLLSNIDYLVKLGAGFFGLFSLLLFLAFIGSFISARRRVSSDAGLAGRVDALSRRVEALSGRAVSGGAPHQQQAPQQSNGELELKVEELRTMVKSLRKAMGLE